MNTDPTKVEQQRVIAQAAASYTPPEPQSHALLMPHRESIAMLRSKGASYRSIAKILAAVQISVSLDTLSRFCRETIEQKSGRKGGRRSAKGTRSGPAEVPSYDSPPPSMSEKPAVKAEAQAVDPAAPPRGRGPRIADPSSI
jgi:hypothetical protein